MGVLVSYMVPDTIILSFPEIVGWTEEEYEENKPLNTNRVAHFVSHYLVTNDILLPHNLNIEVTKYDDTPYFSFTIAGD